MTFDMMLEISQVGASFKVLGSHSNFRFAFNVFTSVTWLLE